MSSTQDGAAPSLQNINDALDILLKKYNIKHTIQPDNLLRRDIDRSLVPANMGSVQTANDAPTSDTLTCHICNIDVPTRFLTAHTNCDRHIVHLKLAHTAVDRINQHISQQINQLRTTPRYGQMNCNNNASNVVYCVECNVIIDETLTDHQSTIEHRIAAESDNFISRLVALYVGNKVADNPVKESNQDPVTKIGKLPEKSDETGKDAEVIVIESVQTMIDLTNEPDEPEIVTIVAKNGDKAVVTKLQWHSISQLGDKYFCCSVCDVLLQPLAELEQHLLLPTHLELVNVTIKNKNCIRKLPNESVHCILCNSIHADKSYHKSQESHRKAVEEAAALYIRGQLELPATESPPEPETKNNSKQKSLPTKEKDTISFYKRKTITKKRQVKEPYLCSTCNVTLPSNHPLSISQHINGKLHRKNCMQNNSPVFTKSVDKSVEKGISQIIAPPEPLMKARLPVMPDSTSVAVCPFCRECFPGQLMRMHMERIHSLRQVTQYRTFCLLCQCTFPHYDHAEMNLHLSHRHRGFTTGRRLRIRNIQTNIEDLDYTIL